MNFMINNVQLFWWIQLNQAQTIATIMVKKALDLRDDSIPVSQGGSEHYPVFSVSCTGECWRHSGLPLNWGFRLTKDRKIKEVR